VRQNYGCMFGSMLGPVGQLGRFRHDERLFPAAAQVLHLAGIKSLSAVP